MCPCIAFPLAPVLGSTGSEEASACKFVGFTATTLGSDFSVPFIGRYGSSPSDRGPTCITRALLAGRTPRPPGSHAKERLHMPGSLTTPDRPFARITLGPFRLPSTERCRHAGTWILSRLNGWPVYSPVNASPLPSRAVAHDSGPVWIAGPSPYETFTHYSLPVSRRSP